MCAAEIVHEYGPIVGAQSNHGVTFDGNNVWAATGSSLVAFSPASNEPERTLECACDAGTAFDGKHPYQIAEKRIDKIDPASGAVVASISTPGNGADLFCCGGGISGKIRAVRKPEYASSTRSPS